MKKIFVIFFLFGFCFAKMSYSETLYLFGGLGVSDYSIKTKDKTEINNKLTNLGFASSTTSAETDNFSYRFGGGIRIPLLFSIEGSYVNLGKVSFTSKTTSPSETLSVDVKIQGLSIDIQKSLGPFALSGGIMRINDTIKLSSSKGNADVPIDKNLIPKIGANIQFNNYRFEFNKVFLTPNSQINSFMLSYIFELF